MNYFRLFILFLLALSGAGMYYANIIIEQNDLALETEANETCKNEVYEHLVETQGDCVSNVTVRESSKRIIFFEPKTKITYFERTFYFKEYVVDWRYNPDEIRDEWGIVFVSSNALVNYYEEKNVNEEKKMLQYIIDKDILIKNSPHDYNVTIYDFSGYTYCGRYETNTSIELRNYSYGRLTGKGAFVCEKN